MLTGLRSVLQSAVFENKCGTHKKKGRSGQFATSHFFLSLRGVQVDFTRPCDTATCRVAAGVPVFQSPRIHAVARHRVLHSKVCVVKMSVQVRATQRTAAGSVTKRSIMSEKFIDRSDIPSLLSSLGVSFLFCIALI